MNLVYVKGAFYTLGVANCPICPVPDPPCSGGSHTFTNVSQSFVKIEGKEMIREGDTQFAHAGDTVWVLTSGRDYVRINGVPVMKEGDELQHEYHPLTVGPTVEQGFVRIH